MPFTNLQISSVTSDSRTSNWIQIGIVSWGFGCAQYISLNGAQTQIPGYYSNVISFTKWINTTLHHFNNNGNKLMSLIKIFTFKTGNLQLILALRFIFITNCSSTITTLAI